MIPRSSLSSSAVIWLNRGHWVIENSCHYILDWAFDEDRSRIRTGYGPANMTRLRHFAIGVIKSKGAENVTQAMRRLTRHVRLVFDYLRMKGLSAKQMERDLLVSDKTAWYLCHRIRKAMEEGELPKFTGTVEAEESLRRGAPQTDRLKADAAGQDKSEARQRQQKAVTARL